MGAGLALQACSNLVVSPTPLITAEDSAAAPELKPGLWADEFCRLSDLVRCRAMMVTREVIDLSTPWKPGSPGDPYASTMPYRLRAGDPLLIQAQLVSQDGSSLSLFGVIEPQSRDSQGQIDAVRLWRIVCGPPPDAEAAKPNKGDGALTDRPFPGVEMNGDHCIVRDKIVLSSAARASRAAITNMPLTYRWIGERWPTQPKP